MTRRLTLAMDDPCGAHGARFAVAFLAAPPGTRAEYARFLHHQGVESIHCAYPITAGMIAPGDGHPNGTLNTRWAACMSEWVARGIR